MLMMTQLPSDHREAVHPTPKAIESVREVLRRRNASSFYYAGLLMVLALIPYASARNP